MAEIVVALDVSDHDKAVALVDQLPGLRWVKIGPTLFVRSGPETIRVLKDRGLHVFLDLKWHDIPNTVSEAARAAADLGVDLATVHALGGPRMIQAARDGAGPMRLAAVTVLTSHEPGEYWRIVGRGSQAEDLGSEVARLARASVAAGAGAIVTSADAVGAVRQAVGRDPWLVVPGIRPPGSSADDQRRVSSPADAIRAGATHLVVGRPVILADEPARVYELLCEAIA